MEFAYVLISIENTYEHEIITELSRLDDIVDVERLLVDETSLADPYFEEYNLIVKIKGKNSNEIKKIVADKIHTLTGIEKTKIVSRSKL